MQQQHGKAVPIHHPSAVANVCRKVFRGFTRLGPKHRDLNTCCNTLLIPHHSAVWSETGKNLMSSRSRSICLSCSQKSTPATGFPCMLGPSLSMQHLVTCNLSPQSQVTPQQLSWHTMLCTMSYSCNSLGYNKLEIQ